MGRVFGPDKRRALPARAVVGRNFSVFLIIFVTTMFRRPEPWL